MNKLSLLFTAFMLSTLTSSGQINEAIKFKITDPNGNTDETIIRLKDESTAAFDPQWDAWKLFTQNDLIPSLYSHTNNEEALTINAIPKMVKDTTLTLLMRARITGGTYLMETEQLGSFPDNIKIAIRDLNTNDVYELNQNQIFNFNVDADPVNDFAKFEIFYSAKSEISVNEDDLTLTNSGCLDWNYEILDINNNVVMLGVSTMESAFVEEIAAGSYTVIITDNYGLKDSLEFAIEEQEEDPANTAGIENYDSMAEPILVKSIEGYYLKFPTTTNENVAEISIYSIDGRLLSNQNVAATGICQIDSIENSGTYIIIVNVQGHVSDYKLIY